MNDSQRKRAQGVLVIFGILASLALWAITFDGCSFGFGCW